MNREDVIRLAREAGLEIEQPPDGDNGSGDNDCLERFAALVAAERDAMCNEALGETDEGVWYEYIGTIDGTYGGRWTLASFAENWSTPWPDNTAVYVRRVSPSKIGEQLGEQELKANVTSKFLEWHAEIVKLAVLAERDSCARICDNHADDPVYCGQAIRARGNT